MLLIVEQALKAAAETRAAVPIRREVARRLGEVMANPLILSHL
jgi:hypothetical protein